MTTDVLITTRDAGETPHRQPLSRWLSAEVAVLAALGMVGATLRFYDLGGAVLANGEAREALAAWQFAMGATAGIEPISAAYSALTSFVFWLFGASDAAARLGSAAFGTALIFLPLTFRRELGRLATAVSVGLLAISPVAIAASRTADATTLAAVALWLMLAGLRRDDSGAGWRLLALGSGLGLAAGSRFLSAALATAMAALLVAVIQSTAVHSIKHRLEKMRTVGNRAAALAVGVFLLVATGALLHRAGLSAAGTGWLEWWRAWLPTDSTRAINLLPQMIFVYEPLLLVFGLCGIYLAFFAKFWLPQVSALSGSELADDEGGDGRQTAAWLSAASFGAMLFGILYTGRTASDALWMVVPLAMLAAVVLAKIFGGESGWVDGDWQTMLAQAGVLTVMLIFAYINVAGYARGALYVLNAPVYLPLMLAGGVVLLGVVVTVLFASGWSVLSAVRGGALALALVLLIGTMSAGWRLAHGAQNQAQELWWGEAPSGTMRLLSQTLRDVSNRTVGAEHDVQVALVGDDALGESNYLLAWELREFRNVEHLESTSALLTVPVVIAPAWADSPALGSSYVGHRFAISARAADGTPGLDRWIDWWLFRVGPSQTTHVVLWVRQDLLTK